ncbi:DegT/DnrJ/EryC1/StrS family aminotransferase [Massilia sp. 9096]|uniref:DegT/DnrJ/EryC1/StrS family aminotransferase n=1 Tax=Massilia sp. 9096 TaxID=1500894 RepID=UPI00056B3561|nr:DegT/DnrJ/EryC1/StrS family aminotransferase [Massilia sp. 9096]
MPASSTVLPTPPARPLVPLAPVLSCASFGRAAAGARSLPSVLDAGVPYAVTSGRIALALALRALGVQAGDTVLLPAYHSLSMVPPVLWRGATPVFYKVGIDTQVDLDDIARHLGPKLKALVVTHYFGFPQDLTAIRSFCDRHGLALVEDCAHCFFGEHAGRPVGSFGDYAIASSMKFFPAYDGGVLVARRPLDMNLHSAGAGFEIKALLNTLELGFAYGRLPLLRAVLAPALTAKDGLWRGLKRLRAHEKPVQRLAPASSESGTEFDPAWVDKRASWCARRLLRMVSGDRIVERRRAHYRQLEGALRDLPGSRPLFAHLPDGACPWLFPLLVDDPEPAFARLCAWGVPVTRFASSLWPGVDATTCAASSRLSRQVLAFPVHQELRADEVDWLVARVREAVQP